MVVQWCIFIASLLVIHTEEKERAARAKKLPTTNPSFVPTNAAALSSFPPSNPSHPRMYRPYRFMFTSYLLLSVT
jgi:HEAT repeat protein